MRRAAAVVALAVIMAGCASSDPQSAPTTPPNPGAAPTTSAASPSTDSDPTATSQTNDPTDACGHDVDPGIVEFGFNEVIGADGTVKTAQGRPFEEGDTLRRTATALAAANDIAYAQVAAYMMPIRDALICDIASTTPETWTELTEVLTVNGIRTIQDLSGTPPEQVYSSVGIYEHLTETDDFNAMMKYLEEAELELKCLAFVDFDFTNPEGDDHCTIHGLDVGSGIVAP